MKNFVQSSSEHQVAEAVVFFFTLLKIMLTRKQTPKSKHFKTLSSKHLLKCYPGYTHELVIFTKAPLESHSEKRSSGSKALFLNNELNSFSCATVSSWTTMPDRSWCCSSSLSVCSCEKISFTIAVYSLQCSCWRKLSVHHRNRIAVDFSSWRDWKSSFNWPNICYILPKFKSRFLKLEVTSQEISSIITQMHWIKYKKKKRARDNYDSS